MKSKTSAVKVMPPHEDDESIAELMQKVLLKIGEDPERPGLVRTPQRADKALRFLTSGYETDVQSIVNGALFEEKCDEMVVVKDIEFYSMCEHHLLPFFGTMHVAYLPNNKLIGLSKIPRIVDMFARRLQLQERLTHQVAETLNDVLRPKGVGVICEARHFCMMMRGVEKQHSGTVTSAMLGGVSRAQGNARRVPLAGLARNHSFTSAEHSATINLNDQEFRDFKAGPDPFGRTWQVYFRWLQTGISIRHADTVDVKFGIGTSGEPFEERVIALPHPVLLALSKKFGHPLTDTWCMKLAAMHLKHMLRPARTWRRRW